MNKDKENYWYFQMETKDKIQFAMEHGFLLEVQNIVMAVFNCEAESVNDYIKDFPIDAWSSMKGSLESKCIDIYCSENS